MYHCRLRFEQIGEKAAENSGFGAWGQEQDRLHILLLLPDPEFMCFDRPDC